MLGVSAVEHCIARSDYLESFISSNDKEPSFDGFINAYGHAGDTHSKDDMLGRAPVQVKGKSCENIKMVDKTFRVDMSDIKNYLQEGGVLFFVVFVTDQDEFIYYEKLLPYDLRNIMKKFGQQKSCTIQLQKFPSDAKKVADIIINFIKDRDKQRTAINAEPVTVDVLKEKGMLQTLSFGFTTVEKDWKNPYEFMFEQEVYIYADLMFGITLPVEKVEHLELITQEIKKKIYVGSRMFYESYRIQYSKDKSEICIGKSIRFYFSEDRKKGEFNLKLAGNLSERIHDEQFIIALLREGDIYFDDKCLHLFDPDSDERLREELEKRQEHLEYLEKCKEVLLKMHVKKELDCDSMQNVDEVNLKRLVSGIAEKNLVKLKDTNSVLGKYRVANLIFLVYAIKDHDTGLYRIYDFFDAPICVEGIGPDNKRFASAPCVSLEKEALLNFDNMDRKEIIRQLRAVKYTEEFESQLTYFLLEILRAYDELRLPTSPLLDLAQDVMDIMQQHNLDHDKLIRYINSLQIQKRRGDLQLTDIKRLEMMSKNEMGLIQPRVMTAIFLLLNNQSEAKRYYEKIEKQEKEEFDQYPICRFIKWKEC